MLRLNFLSTRSFLTPRTALFKPAARLFTTSKPLTATHRDIGSSWGSNNRYERANQTGPLGFWAKWKVPLLFAGGMVAFDYFVLPHIINSAPFAAVRRQPELIVYGLIALNCAGFAMWRIPATSRFMFKYGLLQKDSRFFNVWSMIGSAFSHQEWWHLAINMFVFYQFGVPVARWMGASTFLESYMDGCVLSSLGSMMFPALLGRLAAPSLGASGAVCGVFGTFCYLAPQARLAFWFIPLPVGAWVVFLGTLGYNAAALIGRFGGRLDYAGHVAGSLVGIVYGYIVSNRMERAREYREKLLQKDVQGFFWGRG